MSKYKKVDERCCPLMIDDIDRGSKLMDRIKSKANSDHRFCSYIHGTPVLPVCDLQHASSCCPSLLDFHRNIHMSDESLSPRSITVLIIPQPRDFSHQ